MFNPLSSFKYEDFKLQTNDTNPENILSIIREFIESTQSNVNFTQQANIFLNDEQDNLTNYLEDLTIHYAYKKIFNDAVILHKEYPDEDSFTENFIEYFNDRYIVNLIDDTQLEKFAEGLFALVQAPKKSELKSWSKRLKLFASENNHLDCYICGKETTNKTRKDSICLSDWINPQDNPHYEKICKDIFHLFQKKKIKKTRHNQNKLINSILDIFYKNSTLEYFRREHKKAHTHFNETSMEIEHNFPKSWGGAKNLDNLFVSCHKCNQDKKDITFYSEYSISRFFSNKTSMKEAAKSLRTKLGSEALLSLKMKQNFQCSHEDCNNSFNTHSDFYITKIDHKKGFYYFNLQIECDTCIKDFYHKKIEEMGEKEFFDEFCIKLSKDMDE